MDRGSVRLIDGQPVIWLPPNTAKPRPPARGFYVYERAGSIYRLSSAGVETELGAGSSLTVEDEGTPLATAATTLDFVGAGVTASGTGAEKTITIPGGGSGITVQDEGTPLATDGTTLNFVGAGVTASGTGATKTITIPGGGGGASLAVPDIVQFKEATNAVTSVSITAPTNGNSLILFTNSTTGQVTNVACTNVTWTQLLTHTGTGAYYAIWIGVVAASAGTSITMTKPGSFNSVMVVEVTDALTPTIGANTASTMNTDASHITELTGGTASRLVIYAVSNDNTTVITHLFPSTPSSGQFEGIMNVLVGYSHTGRQAIFSRQQGSAVAGAALMLEVT